MIRAGVIGYGYWGPNVVRNLARAPAIRVVAVCDERPERLARAREAVPDVFTTTDAGEILGDPSIDAVAIITPVATHYELALAALRAGKHVWIEKPITACSREARRLRDEAEARGLVVFVDHTFVYEPAVNALRDLALAGAIGRLVTYDSVRANLGLFRPDANVLWDLAVHDLAIVDHAFSARPLAVSATGVAAIAGMPEHTAFMTCFLEGGAVMHVRADWLAPTKGRTTTVVGDRAMVVYDDTEPVDRVRLYDRGVDLAHRADRPPVVAYRSGTARTPDLPKIEALGAAASHFADCILAGKKPVTDAEFGLRVVRVLEAAVQSMKARGRPVEIGGEA